MPASTCRIVEAHSVQHPQPIRLACFTSQSQNAMQLTCGCFCGGVSDGDDGAETSCQKSHRAPQHRPPHVTAANDRGDVDGTDAAWVSRCRSSGLLLAPPCPKACSGHSRKLGCGCCDGGLAWWCCCYCCCQSECGHPANTNSKTMNQHWLQQTVQPTTVRPPTVHQSRPCRAWPDRYIASKLPQHIC